MHELQLLARAAFAAMIEAPRSLSKRLALEAADRDLPTPNAGAVEAALRALQPNDSAALEIAGRLRAWDHASASPWSGETDANSQERRDLIYDVLDVPLRMRAVMDLIAPPYVSPGPVVVTASEVAPWYTYEHASQGFYWREYTRYLSTKKGWGTTDQLDRSTFNIVANLVNPTQPERYQAKGLVVGHVQSGKTANFTGVLARAADAGYRLFIVLTGTTNILRRQTQRRIDKELLGRDLVGDDYQYDPDWPDFADHGALPSVLGFFDWLRLTGPDADFRLLGYGSPVLDFKRLDQAKPFFDPVNLRGEEARIMVVKKNSTVLAKVVKDLKPYAASLADVPAVIIDDESDQASLDTSKPTAAETRQRTKVNAAIIRLLRTLPRSQYIGYTATPFANVFVNPDDAEDLFPRDFIAALDKPPGYMGAAEFHDLDGPPVEGRPSNEADFVRSLRGDDEDSDNLLRALDSFVLSGGAKLYRERALGLRFPHHTMLVHVSQNVDNHTAMRDLIERVVEKASYRAPDALKRLRRLFDEDFRRVSNGRGGTMPETFEELEPFVASCLDRLFAERRSVLIVNGQKESDTPDFDRDSVWKILVGGNKLSRGYTIEGLTVSYYRRRADAADTLMQMGRWFGYRAGYMDLVRLFIGREEPKPHGEIVDLYKAFEGACRDENAFREELARYAGLPGDERILPIQVPPLVQAHMLRPTSSNKMYHAELLATNLGGDYREPTVAPALPADAEHNQAACRAMLSGTIFTSAGLSIDGSSTTEALTATVSPERVVSFLRAYMWLPDKRPVQRDLDYLTNGQFNPRISDWLVLAPQLQAKNADQMFDIGGVEFSIKNRARESTGGRYGVYSEPDHVRLAKFIAAHDAIGVPNDALADLCSKRRAVMLLYPVQWYGHESIVTIGFALAYPPIPEPKRLVWGVRDSASPAGDGSGQTVA